MLAGMLAVLAISVSDHPAWAQEPPPRADTVVPVERPVEDEVILAVRLDRHLLSDGVIGYLHRGGVLLPLGDGVTLVRKRRWRGSWSWPSPPTRWPARPRAGC